MEGEIRRKTEGIRDLGQVGAQNQWSGLLALDDYIEGWISVYLSLDIVGTPGRTTKTQTADLTSNAFALGTVATTGTNT